MTNQSKTWLKNYTFYKINVKKKCRIGGLNIILIA